MLKRLSIFLICFLLLGCSNDVYSVIKQDKKVAINYPVTNIGVLDEAISSYVNKNYSKFKCQKKSCEFNVSYTYNELNDNVINIGLNTFINDKTTVNKIKTFTYDKKTKKFLTMENIVKDLDALDYDIKKRLLEKYREADMDFLSDFNYDYFTIDDQNLTIYFNPAEIKGNNNIIYLDIPLNSLDLLIDNQITNNTYIDLKKKNIDSSSKVVALTFDDGPSKYTDQILKILNKHKACATFFIVGNKVPFYKKTLTKMIKNGNEIGNHSYSHRWLNKLPENEFKNDINQAQNTIKKYTGFTPVLFRPTYGGYSDKLKSYTDLTFVLWDVDSRDWKVKNKTDIFNNIISNVKNGSIVLMHDNHKYAVDALDDVLFKLENDGYEFVTVSELLEIKKLRENE